MDQARTRLIAGSEKVAARGLDVEPINNEVTELRRCVEKVANVRAFLQPKYFPAGCHAGRTSRSTRRRAHQQSPWKRHKYRQIGLAVSIAFDRAFDACHLFET